MLGLLSTKTKHYEELKMGTFLLSTSMMFGIGKFRAPFLHKCLMSVTWAFVSRRYWLFYRFSYYFLSTISTIYPVLPVGADEQASLIHDNILCKLVFNVHYKE